MTEIGEETLKQYRGYLADREKSIATIDKYLRDIRTFLQWMGENRSITKEKGMAAGALQNEQCKQHAGSPEWISGLYGRNAEPGEDGKGTEADVPFHRKGNEQGRIQKADRKGLPDGTGADRTHHGDHRSDRDPDQ